MLGNSGIVVRDRGTRRSWRTRKQKPRPPLANFGGFTGWYPQKNFYCLNNLTSIKIGPNSTQSPQLLKTRNFFLATPLVVTQRQPKQVIEWSHRATLGLDPKCAKDKFQNFKMNTMSLVALHTRIQCSQRFKNANACKFTAPCRITKTCNKNNYWRLRKNRRSWSLNSNTLDRTLLFDNRLNLYTNSVNFSDPISSHRSSNSAKTVDANTVGPNLWHRCSLLIHRVKSAW